jgi:uncharacterized protein YdiU (UPF0061 family)
MERDAMTAPYRPDPQFSKLGDAFSTPVDPADFPTAGPVWWNGRWAREVGLELNETARQAHFHHFDPLTDNQHRPRAVKYHGHQFRVYNPEIGDGRGFLFAQLRDSHDRLLDLGTKGSGQTPFSRAGDGRLTLKGAVREILAAEMLEALGVYTSKIFSVFETGEQLHRGDEPSPTRSAVMTRLGHSHMRFGVFQRHAYHDDAAALETLIDYSLEHLLPDADHTRRDKAAALLDAVARNSARLSAQWMAAGFVHGVLNTDNLVVTGESFDYGPWRFLPHFDPGFTAAYFDHSGLYAYARQPEAVFWALQQLAGALSLVGDREALIEALSAYPDHYKREIRTAFLARLGVAEQDEEADGALVTQLLDFMKASEIPFEAVFFDWFCGPASATRADASARAAFYQREDFAPVRKALETREPIRPERLAHPYFAEADPVHLTIEVVEGLWEPIARDNDWSAFHAATGRIAQARAAYDLGRGRVGFLPETGA